jgi:cbb3-type cytochrome oxidase subunit 3
MTTDTLAANDRQCEPQEGGAIAAFVIGFMMFANVVDMGGGWLIKYLSAFVAGGYVLLNVGQLQVRLTPLLIVVVVFGVGPVWALTNGIMSGGILAIAMTRVTPFFVGIIYYLLLSRGGSRLALRVFFRTVLGLAVMTIVLIVGLFLYPDFPPLSATFDYLKTLDDIQGKFGRRGLGPVIWYVIYFKATLFYVPAFVYYLYRERFVYSAILFIALTLSVSKSGILICGLLTVWFILTHGPLRVWAGIIGMVAVLLAIALYVVDVELTMAYANHFIETVTGEAKTSQIRIGQLKSFVDLMGEHPTYLLWGQGVGTKFYSVGKGEFTYNIELAHIDTIRQFGLLWFIAFSLCVAYVAFRLVRRKERVDNGLGYAMVSIFAAAGTNPLLISPLFMMLLATTFHYDQKKDYLVM